MRRCMCSRVCIYVLMKCLSSTLYIHNQYTHFSSKGQKVSISLYVIHQDLSQVSLSVTLSQRPKTACLSSLVFWPVQSSGWSETDNEPLSGGMERSVRVVSMSLSITSQMSSDESTCVLTCLGSHQRNIAVGCLLLFWPY